MKVDGPIVPPMLTGNPDVEWNTIPVGTPPRNRDHQRRDLRDASPHPTGVQR